MGFIQYTTHSNMEKMLMDGIWLLSFMFKIFHESLSRCAEYEMLVEAQNSDYQLQFFGHRWVEHKNVAKRATNVWPMAVCYCGWILEGACKE